MCCTSGATMAAALAGATALVLPSSQVIVGTFGKLGCGCVGGGGGRGGACGSAAETQAAMAASAASSGGGSRRERHVPSRVQRKHLCTVMHAVCMLRA